VPPARLDRQIDGVGGGLHFGVSRIAEERLVDLDMTATRVRERPEIPPQQLRQIEHHLADIAVVFVIGDRRQHVGSGHGDLDRFFGEGGHLPELIHQTQIDVVPDPVLASRRRMEDVGVLLGDRLRTRAALKSRDLLPEKFSIAFGGECRLWVRRCISPPVMTSMPASS